MSFPGPERHGLLVRDQHRARKMSKELEDQGWHRMPRETVESPSLEILKAHLNNIPINLF